MVESKLLFWSHLFPFWRRGKCFYQIVNLFAWNIDLVFSTILKLTGECLQLKFIKIGFRFKVAKGFEATFLTSIWRFVGLFALT